MVPLRPPLGQWKGPSRQNAVRLAKTSEISFQKSGKPGGLCLKSPLFMIPLFYDVRIVKISY